MVSNGAARDTIHIRGLAARAIIGVNAEERAKRQDILLDLAVEHESKAGRTDRIQDAVDYKALKRSVLEHVEGSDFHLLETLAESTATLCLGVPGVKAVTVTIDKPGALRFARSVAVTIRREAA